MDFDGGPTNPGAGRASPTRSQLNRFTRRSAIRSVAVGSAALGSLGLPRFLRGDVAIAADTPESHGLSAFGDLAQPPDFKHFAYVNPDAPKGGTLIITINSTSGNQTFETFDTLNIWVLKGDGAAGMSATFDTLMSGTSDEPDSLYGLVAKSVAVSPDKLTYRFRLRPEARFHDGSRLTAKDVAFSLTTLKTQGHTTYKILLDKMDSAEAEDDEIVVVKFSPKRTRDLHLIVAGMPIFSAAFWKPRDFQAQLLEPPLGSGAYKVDRFNQGSFIEFKRVADYWGRDLPVNVGTSNFDKIRFEYFREPQISFEAFKSGIVSFREENSSRNWHQAYHFPSIDDGRVEKEVLHSGQAAGAQGWYFNTRREVFKDPRIREAIGCAFDFEWTNKVIMYSSYKRTKSYFENSPNMARGKPSPDELALLEPFRDKLPPEVFGEVALPPVSDGSGVDRNLLRRADGLLREAGCTRKDGRILLPSGKPLAFEFLDSTPLFQPHLQPFIGNLRRLGIEATSRIVDSSQYKARTDQFDYDIVALNAGGSLTPGDEVWLAYSSNSAKMTASRNLSGISDPVVDVLCGKISGAKSRKELTSACQALDRVLRAGRYWVPMWYRDEVWVAFWDIYDRPKQQPKFGTGAPDTWWVEPDKAKKIKVGG